MDIIIASIVLITMVVLVVMGVRCLIEGATDKDIVCVFIGIFLIALVIVPSTSMIYDSYQEANSTVQVINIDACVVDKEYKAPYTSYILSGKTSVPVHHSEQYNVQFKYQDVSTVIDNKDLYNQVDKNDKIQMKLKTYIRKNGDVYKKEMDLE